MTKEFKSNIRYFFFLLVTTLVSAEIILHIYNPVEIRIKGDQIILPENKKYIYKNEFRNNIDSVIFHTKNSIGFRGENPPSLILDSFLTIICVGGSTTECVYLTDGKDWPALLSSYLKNDFSKVWVNNAGLNGHSTYGHLLLMEDYISKIKPKIVVFLVGINDVGRRDISGIDERYLKLKMPWYIRGLKKSELYNLFANYRRSLKAAEFQLTDENMIDKYLKGDTVYKYGSSDNPDLVNAANISLVSNYEKRVQLLINECKKYNIDPVFVTQPLLLGNTVDSATGLNFGDIKLASGISGLQYWNILQIYNAATKKIASNNNCFLIDLADSMPKKRQYFYDMMHYTNNGSAFVAGIIYRNIKIYLEKKYPQFRIQPVSPK